MAYYDKVYVVVNIGYIDKDLDFKYATEILPACSLPQAVINLNTKIYFEIEDLFKPEEIIDYLKNNPKTADDFKDIKMEDLTIIYSRENSIK